MTSRVTTGTLVLGRPPTPADVHQEVRHDIRQHEAFPARRSRWPWALVASELQMPDVRQQVALSLATEFENYTIFKPGN